MNQSTLQIIAKRSSRRCYKPDQLTEAQLDAIVAAALQAPSANNAQPWQFIVVQDQELLAQINAAATKNAMKREASNRSPRFNDPAFNIFYHAPTVIFISAPDGRYTPLDCGIAVQNIALAAESLGLGSVILGMPREAFEGDDKETLEKALRFPENHVFHIAIALGTPDDSKEPHEVDYGKVTYIR